MDGYGVVNRFLRGGKAGSGHLSPAQRRCWAGYSDGAVKLMVREQSSCPHHELSRKQRDDKPTHKPLRNLRALSRKWAPYIRAQHGD